MDKNASNTSPVVYLKTKRKELGMNQGEFADIFGISKDVYRKYEENARNLPDDKFLIMKKTIEYYEKLNLCEKTIVSVEFLETARQECLVKIFKEEHHVIVNLVFDFLERKESVLHKTN